VASHTNRGHAVDGFTERTALEYSFYMDESGLSPAADLYVPSPFEGLISALAEHQTLLGDAIATEDPRTLFQALYAYPIQQNTRNSRKLYRELLKVHKPDIPAWCQEAATYFEK
jgi:alpha-galactosidase/6-phospho-beta-glucosidase family protein